MQTWRTWHPEPETPLTIFCSKFYLILWNESPDWDFFSILSNCNSILKAAVCVCVCIFAHKYSTWVDLKCHEKTVLCFTWRDGVRGRFEPCVFQLNTASLPLSLQQRINYCNTQRCVTSQLISLQEKHRERETDCVVLCVCVTARWNTSLCGASEGRRVSRVRSPAPPRSPRSNTPGWSVWCAPCWGQKQNRGHEAVSDERAGAIRPHVIILLIIFISLIENPACSKFSRRISILTIHLIC